MDLPAINCLIIAAVFIAMASVWAVQPRNRKHWRHQQLRSWRKRVEYIGVDCVIPKA